MRARPWIVGRLAILASSFVSIVTGRPTLRSAVRSEYDLRSYLLCAKEALLQLAWARATVHICFFFTSNLSFIGWRHTGLFNCTAEIAKYLLVVFAQVPV
jgi:hypothetical protein